MKRIWNRSNPALYSVSTISSSGIPNMNICSWVTKISMNPPFFLLSIDTASKTYENIIYSKECIVQLLSKDAKKYVRRLGYTSGHRGNKLAGIAMKRFGTFFYLPECLGFLWFRVHDQCSFGDHTQFICSCIRHVTIQDGEPLRLRDVLP